MNCPIAHKVTCLRLALSRTNDGFALVSTLVGKYPDHQHHPQQPHFIVKSLNIFSTEPFKGFEYHMIGMKRNSSQPLVRISSKGDKQRADCHIHRVLPEAKRLQIHANNQTPNIQLFSYPVCVS